MHINNQKNSSLNQLSSIQPWLFLVIIIGLFLRLFKLASRPLNFDEAFSFYIANCDTLRTLIKEIVKQDAHPPLWDLMLRFWIYLGKGEWIMRSLSVLIGMASLILIFLFCKRFLQKKTALWTSAIMAISPFWIYYSQEARMYTLVGFLTLLSTCLFGACLRREESKPWWALVLVNTLGLYTHYFMGWIIIAQNIYFFSQAKRFKSFISRWLFSQVVTILLFLPWFSVLMGRLSTEVQDVQTLGTGLIIPYSFFEFSLGRSIANIYSRADILPNLWIILLAGVIFGFLFIIGILNLFRNGQRQELYLLLLLISVPILGAFLLTIKLPRVFNAVKYVIMASPFYYMILAEGLAGLRKNWRLVFSIGIIGLSTFSLYNYYFDKDFESRTWNDWPAIAKYVELYSQPLDIILFDASYMHIPFDYYYAGSNRTHGLETSPALGKNKALAEIKNKTTGSPRVWLVLCQNWRNRDFFKDLFDEKFKRVDKQKYPGVNIYLYKIDEN